MRLQLSIYLSNYIFVYLFVFLSVYLSARLKTKLFCQTSSIFELDNIKNAAILRDFLNFWTWQRQKRNYSARPPQFFKLTTSKPKQFCETSFKNGKLSAKLTASYQCVLRFCHSICLKYCACHEKWCRVIRSAAPVTRNHLSKPEDLMLQRCNPSQEISARTPNISDEDVSCTVPATQNASFQILFKCPMAAIVFGNATKPSHFAHFWQGAESLAHATQNHIWTF